MGQAQYPNITDAQEALWSNVIMTGFPSFEFRPIWKVIFQAQNGSAIKAAIRAVDDLRTFQGTVASTEASLPPPQTIEAVTTRSIVDTDAGKMLTSSSNCVLTFNASTAFNQGQRVDIVRLGGTLTVSASGVTLLFTPANTLRAINSAASIVCLDSTTYLLVGDLG
jgi:hypothetical protein